MLHPTTQDIIERLNAGTVCTTTQCFDTFEDAGMGMDTLHVRQWNLFTLFLMMSIFYSLLLFSNRSVPNNNKPSTIIHNNINDLD